MLEGAYKTKLIGKIRKRLPGCYILKNDASYMQGIPDLSVFYGPLWGFLEVKAKTPRSGTDDFEPNQEWYIEDLNNMGFAACIYPANELEVLDALQSYLANTERLLREVQRPFTTRR